MNAVLGSVRLLQPRTVTRESVVPRLIAAACAVLWVTLGLAARALLAGQFFWWKNLGVLFWCWVVHACVRFVSPRLSVPMAAVWMVAISFAVEFLQLTGLSRWLSSHHWFLRQVFGEVFSPLDLLQAVIAGLLVMPVDAAIRRVSAGLTAPGLGANASLPQRTQERQITESA